VLVYFTIELVSNAKIYISPGVILYVQSKIWRFLGFFVAFFGAILFLAKKIEGRSIDRLELTCQKTFNLARANEPIATDVLLDRIASRKIRIMEF
jgi:hypothetical protein